MVPGVKFAGNPRLGEFVGHGHGAHEPWDGFRIDGNDTFSGVGRNHNPPQLVSRSSRLRLYRRWFTLASFETNQ
jgi:hypothetical protein